MRVVPNPKCFGSFFNQCIYVWHKEVLLVDIFKDALRFGRIGLC